MAEKILVRITARQRVSYDQIVSMTPEDWQKFKETSPSDHVCGGGDLVGGWLDSRPDDGEDIDDDDFEAVVVDAKGKPLGDEYTWTD